MGVTVGGVARSAVVDAGEVRLGACESVECEVAVRDNVHWQATSSLAQVSKAHWKLQAFWAAGQSVTVEVTRLARAAASLEFKHEAQSEASDGKLSQ